MKRIVLTLIGAAFMAACGGGPGTSVSIRFGTPGTTAGPSPANFSLAGGQATDGQIHLSGTNGDLDIDGIWVIVEEFELEAVETVDCDDDELGTDDCEDFEREYFFINVPLDGSTVVVVSAPIADGTYDELEFEVDDIHVHPDDPEEQAEADLIAALRDDVLAAFPMWPEEASMLVTGTWTPTGGSAVTFATYFDADIEVEKDLPEPYVVSADATSGDISVLLYPERWFERTDGTVWDLKSLEGQLVDFDLEIEEGFDLKID